MRMDSFVRVGGGAAILAGVLRAVGSFVSGGSEVERQSLYFIVDLLLLLNERIVAFKRRCRRPSATNR